MSHADPAPDREAPPGHFRCPHCDGLVRPQPSPHLTFCPRCECLANSALRVTRRELVDLGAST